MSNCKDHWHLCGTDFLEISVINNTLAITALEHQVPIVYLKLLDSKSVLIKLHWLLLSTYHSREFDLRNTFPFQKWRYFKDKIHIAEKEMHLFKSTQLHLFHCATLQFIIHGLFWLLMWLADGQDSLPALYFCFQSSPSSFPSEHFKPFASVTYLHDMTKQNSCTGRLAQGERIKDCINLLMNLQSCFFQFFKILWQYSNFFTCTG